MCVCTLQINTPDTGISTNIWVDIEFLLIGVFLHFIKWVSGSTIQPVTKTWKPGLHPSINITAFFVGILGDLLLNKGWKLTSTIKLNIVSSHTFSLVWWIHPDSTWSNSRNVIGSVVRLALMPEHLHSTPNMSGQLLTIWVELKFVATISYQCNPVLDRGV